MNITIDGTFVWIITYSFIIFAIPGYPILYLQAKRNLREKNRKSLSMSSQFLMIAGFLITVIYALSIHDKSLEWHGWLRVGAYPFLLLTVYRTPEGYSKKEFVFGTVLSTAVLLYFGAYLYFNPAFNLLGLETNLLQLIFFLVSSVGIAYQGALQALKFKRTGSRGVVSWYYAAYFPILSLLWLVYGYLIANDIALAAASVIGLAFNSWMFVEWLRASEEELIG